MKINSLYDLDELVLACRDKQAKEYIREAVACYKSGAFRACIVATWIAVVFDYIHKLGQLDLTGDKEARKQLELFESLRNSGGSDIAQALKFEREVLETAANKFELLTPLELADLARLQEDRNRCAHPSMQSLDEPYEPTPELARTHLRHAVEILLQREPVQGKAALDRIWADIRSDYFPDTPEKARDHFAKGPLNRAKPSMIRDVILGLTKSLLLEQRNEEERNRQFAALGAVILMYHDLCENVLRQDLPDILVRVTDADLPRSIEYLWKVQPSWSFAGNAFKSRVQFAVEKADLDDADKELTSVGILHAAMHLPKLKSTAEARLSKVSSRGLRQLLRLESHPAYIEAAVQMVETTPRWTDLANLRSGALRIALQAVSVEQYRRLVNALTESNTVRTYGGWSILMDQLWHSQTWAPTEAADGWKAVYKIFCKPNSKLSGQTMRKTLQDTFADLKEPDWPEEVAAPLGRGKSVTAPAANAPLANEPLATPPDAILTVPMTFVVSESRVQVTSLSDPKSTICAAFALSRIGEKSLSATVSGVAW